MHRKRILIDLSGLWTSVAMAALAFCVSHCEAQVTATQASPKASDNKADKTDRPTLVVKKTKDLEVTGKGDAESWNRAQWTPLNRRDGGKLDYQARIKMLYSDSGVYVLFDGTDRKLTATLKEDFLDLWTEDVYECFFWTDQQHPVYFEYEISPLGYELPILVPKFNGKFLGWRPWHYEGERKIQKKVAVSGGKAESMASADGWRANFYRVDHDGGQQTAWDWARVGPSFHEIENYGTLVFE